MSRPLSHKEYETLSAYIDGQLSPRERGQVEARIQNHPEWRLGFEEIQYTRRLLRSLPKRRAPRNFTINPAVAGTMARPAYRAYPFLRLVSAIASILLVIVFASDMAMNLTAQSIMRSSGAANENTPSEKITTMDQATQPAGAPMLAVPPTEPLAPNQTPAPAQAEQSGLSPAQPTENLTPEPQLQLGPNMATSQAVPSETPPAVGFGGGCEGTCGPEATPAEPGFSAQSLPATSGETPVPDETQHAIQAMTEAPLGVGSGPSPDETQSAESASKMAPETPPAPATSPGGEASSIQPTATPGAQEQVVSPSTRAFAPMAPKQATVSSSTSGQQLSPNPSTSASSSQPEAAPTRVPPLRWVEALLAGIAVITGIGAIVLRLRSSP